METKEIKKQQKMGIRIKNQNSGGDSEHSDDVANFEEIDPPIQADDGFFNPPSSHYQFLESEIELKLSSSSLYEAQKSADNTGAMTFEQVIELCPSGEYIPAYLIQGQAVFQDFNFPLTGQQDFISPSAGILPQDQNFASLSPINLFLPHLRPLQAQYSYSSSHHLVPAESVDPKQLQQVVTDGAAATTGADVITIQDEEVCDEVPRSLGSLDHKVINKIASSLLHSGTQKNKNNRVYKKRDRIPHLKKDSKITLEEKLANFFLYTNNLKSEGYKQILMRAQVVRELGFDSDRAKKPFLNMSGWDDIVKEIKKKSLKSELKEVFELETNLICRRSNLGSTINLYFSYNEKTMQTSEEEVYELIIHSIVIPDNSNEATKSKRWFHYIRGGAYVTLAQFVLGPDFDYVMNDNQAEPTVGNDLKIISAKKRCLSRLRSHAKNVIVVDPFLGCGSSLEICHIEPKLRKQLDHHTFFQIE